MTDYELSVAAVPALIVGYILWQFIWVDPRRRKEAAKARARWAEERQKREISIAEAKQHSNAERIRIGEEEWQKKLDQFQNRLDGATRSGIVRCNGRDFIKLLDWHQLEEAVAFLLTEEGWKAELTGHGPDKGVDIKCEKTYETGITESLVVQVKHFTVGSVGAPVVRQILGAAVLGHISKALVATSTNFSKGVKEEFADAVELWDGDTLSYRIDSLSDEQFGRLAQPFKLILADHAVAEQKLLDDEERRREQERDSEQLQATIREKQLKVLKCMEQAGKPWPDCPECGKQMAVRLGKSYFWGCASYPSCRGTRQVPTN